MAVATMNSIPILFSDGRSYTTCYPSKIRTEFVPRSVVSSYSPKCMHVHAICARLSRTNPSHPTKSNTTSLELFTRAIHYRLSRKFIKTSASSVTPTVAPDNQSIILISDSPRPFPTSTRMASLSSFQIYYRSDATLNQKFILVPEHINPYCHRSLSEISQTSEREGRIYSVRKIKIHYLRHSLILSIFRHSLPAL